MASTVIRMVLSLDKGGNDLHCRVDSNGIAVDTEMVIGCLPPLSSGIVVVIGAPPFIGVPDGGFRLFGRYPIVGDGPANSIP